MERFTKQYLSRPVGAHALRPIRFGKALRFLRSEVEAFEKAALDKMNR